MTFYPILKPTTARLQHLAMLVLAVIYLVLGTIVLAYDAIFPSDNTYQLHAGDIASDDIFAPEDRTYESAVLTNQARQVAWNNTRPVYDRIANVSRDQVETARDIVEYITLTRNDQYASREQQLNDLLALQDLKALDEGF